MGAPFFAAATTAFANSLCTPGRLVLRRSVPSHATERSVPSASTIASALAAAAIASPHVVSFPVMGTPATVVVLPPTFAAAKAAPSGGTQP